MERLRIGGGLSQAEAVSTSDAVSSGEHAKMAAHEAAWYAGEEEAEEQWRREEKTVVIVMVVIVMIVIVRIVIVMIVVVMIVIGMIGMMNVHDDR